MNNYIISYHGLWEAYTPEVPDGVPKNVLFCRRVGDGIDFYENRSTLVPENSYNFTAELKDGKYEIVSASGGDVPCYPAGKHYFTILGWDKPFEELVRYRVDETTFELEPKPVEPVIPRISSRQFTLQLLNMGLLDQVEAWVKTQDRAIQLAYEKSATFVKDDAMMQAGFTALGFTEEQVDAFFEAAAML